MEADVEPVKSDMHHLFPTKDNVDSSRSNHPYDEIPDSVTDTWYFLDQSRSDPSDADVDSWSEKDNDHSGYVFRPYP